MPYYLSLFVDLSNIFALVLAQKNKKVPDFSAKAPSLSPNGVKRRTYRSLRHRIATFFTNSSNKTSTPNRNLDLTLNPLRQPTERRLVRVLDTEKDDLLHTAGRQNYPEDSGSHMTASVNLDKSAVRAISMHSLSPPPMISSSANQQATLLGELRIQIHNMDSLAVLGNVGEIIIGKTDLLTSRTFKLKELATRAKNYQFGDTEFKADMAGFRSNPELYNQDDSIDDDNVVEEETYSEKLQEYQSELDCNYDHLLMDSEEDNDLTEQMKHLTYPRYLSESRAAMMFGVGDELPSAVKPPESAGKLGASKMEDLTSFYNLLKLSQDKNGQRVNFSSRIIEKPNKAKQIAERLHKVIEKSNAVSPKNAPAQKQGSFEYNLSGVFPSQKLVSSRNLSNNSKVMSRIDDDVISSRSLDDLIKHTAIHEENEPIKINFTKEYGVRNFISDLANKKHHLDDLVNYLYLFQECSSLSKNKKHRNQASTLEIKEALGDVFREFGYRFKSMDKKRMSDGYSLTEQDIKPQSLFYNVRIDNHYGVVANFLVKLVNEYTNNRKRMSLIVCDKEKNIDVNYLLVQGEEKYMRHCMKLNKRNKNMYKMLTSKYRASGNKLIVVGIKVLEKEEVDEYINSFISLLKTSRDQIQNLEKLAISLETDLSYFGMVGVLNEVRPDAYTFSEAVKKAGIALNMFTGDSLDRCLYVARKLKLSECDFTRSSDYFHLNFKTESRAHFEIKRIFETIYTTLKKADISEKTLVKLESQKAKSESYKKKLMNWLRYLRSDSTEEAIEKIIEEKSVIGKKTLLLSGQALGVIMKSDHLTKCLQAIVAMSNSVIIHSAQPVHSAFLIDILRKRSESAVLAIGDGFNFFGTLRKADVSIQIQNEDVPLIFGDFLVKDLKTVHQLLFYNSFHVFKANLTMIFIEFWRSLPYVFLMIGYLQCSHYSGVMVTNFHLLTFYIAGCMQLLFCNMVDAPYKKELAAHMHDFYVENKFAETYSTRIFVIIIICSIVEASYLATFLWFFLSIEIAPNGQPLYSIEIVQDFAFLGAITIGTFKNTFMAMRRLFLTACINFTVLGLCFVLYYYRCKRTEKGILDSHPPFTVFGSQNLAIFFGMFCIVPIYLSYCVSLYFKAKLMAPYSKVIRQAYTFKDLYKDFVKEIDNMRVKLITDIYRLSIDEYISKIKSYFNRGVDFEPLERIAFIDTFTNRSGLSYFSNRIQDKGEAKRFKILQIRAERRVSRRLLLILIVMMIIQWGLILVLRQAPNYGFDTYIPHSIMVAAVPLAMFCIKRNYETVYTVVTLSMTMIVMITIAFTFGNQQSTWGNTRFAVSRILFSSFPLDYVIAVLLGTICDIFSFIE